MFATYYTTFLCDLDAILMRLGRILEVEDLGGTDVNPRLRLSLRRWVRREAR